VDQAAQRLLQNQAHIGAAIEPFYGAAAAAQLTGLLRGHILTAARLIGAAKTGDTAAVHAASRAWYANADSIADFLGAANPRHWPPATLRSAMRMHLDLTLQEATARLTGDWLADIAAYDAVHRHILQMADVLSDGIVAHPRDPHLAGTELRVARAYRELFAGLQGDEPALRTFPNPERGDELVSVTDIPFHSVCAHHLLPFFGSAHVAYQPAERIVGLSKLARVVEYFARRPQVQERLTAQIADLVHRRLRPAGLIVVVRARHCCMEMRGVNRTGLVTTTSAVRGILPAERRREFLALLSRPTTDLPAPAAGT
jgi:GTP cyclohydrolase I